MPQKTDLATRIAIVGAGPAGLSAAYYLKQQGYTQVTVLEKLGRVGGLCRSITDGYKSFDLGGNYITPAYRETRKLAASVGARPIPAKEYVGARVDGDTVSYHDLQDITRQDPADPRKRVGLLALALAIVRFGWLRFKLRSVIDGPTLARVHDQPELCVSFEEWLRDNDLLAMRRMFEIPITMMGYGFLDQIAAPYALKYMSLPTYRAMILRGLPLLGSYARWPKRFEHGFQRMWEQLSWDLNVRLGVEITKITRNPQSEHPICIRYWHEEQIGSTQIPREGELWFDRLILACPLTENVLQEFLDLSDLERELFAKVQTYSFCQISCHCVDEAGKDFKLEKPVVCVFPFDRETIGKPWAVVQYWGDESPMLQLYSRISLEDDIEVDHEDVIRAAKKLLARMKARVAGDLDPAEARWTFYTRWPYFGHVSAEEMSKGFFWDLERLQGESHTYYAGGVTNFELIEPIVQYSKNLIETHFARE